MVSRHILLTGRQAHYFHAHSAIVLPLRHPSGMPPLILLLFTPFVIQKVPCQGFSLSPDAFTLSEIFFWFVHRVCIL
jgi:hypothetical protein